MTREELNNMEEELVYCDFFKGFEDEEDFEEEDYWDNNGFADEADYWNYKTGGKLRSF